MTPGEEYKLAHDALKARVAVLEKKRHLTPEEWEALDKMRAQLTEPFRGAPDGDELPIDKIGRFASFMRGIEISWRLVVRIALGFSFLLGILVALKNLGVEWPW